jgi:predicted ATPase
MGEPGIGKTRMLEEFAERVRAQGTLVLWGRCYEGEAGRPYGPFAEAIGEYVRAAAVEGLVADLGAGAAPLGRLVPGLRELLPDLPEPAPLEPYEERVRLLDAVTQFLLALAARVPTVLVLDARRPALPGGYVCHALAQHLVMRQELVDGCTRMLCSPDQNPVQQFPRHQS